MAVMKEWRCKAHGDFPGTHPICPSMGCQSKNVERVFLTPPRIGNAQHKRFDAGMRNTADRMGITNWNDAREGETSFSGRGAPGTEVLWGSDIQKVTGKPMQEMVNQAQAPLSVQRSDGTVDTLTDNNALRQVARESGITMNRIPTAERTVHKADQKSMKG